MISEISAFELHQLLLKEANVVILDPREEGLFSLSPHIFQSINLPLSRIEWRLNYVLPKKSINIVVASDDEHLNDRTIKRLQEMGYLQLKKLKGGLILDDNSLAAVIVLLICSFSFFNFSSVVSSFGLLMCSVLMLAVLILTS